MGKIEDLAAEYERHICVPWQRTITGAQRVVMVVYEKELERTLRTRIGEFEQRTLSTGHGWTQFDCTKLFAQWMAADDYRDAYFESPEDLELKLEAEFLNYVTQPIREILRKSDENTVVAVTGIGSLYGFLRVSDLIRSLEPDIAGRLLIFYPGTKDGNVYRLMDARDGWNYLAQCITLHGTGGLA